MKSLRRVLTASLITTLMLAPAMPGQSAGISLTVQPLVAEFSTKPGENGRATVTVQNSSGISEKISIRRTDWRTLADGSIALEKVGTERAHSITRNLSLSSYQFNLGPGERRDVSLHLTVPASLPQSPASYWGGFVVNANYVNAPPSSVGIAATVFVYNNIGSPPRHITLQSLHIVRGTDGVNLIARLRNDAPGYARPNAHILVEQAGRILRDEHVNLSTVFPNSTRIMVQHLGSLMPGEYRVEVLLDYGGNSIIDGVTQARVQ